MSEAAQETPNAEWTLRLYVAGQSPKALAAFVNLKRICAEHLEGRYEIEIVDLKADGIVALPTLVRRLPPPIRKIIGDLSNEEKVLVALDLDAGRS